MKIASRKNEKPSIANPSPKTPPNVPVKFGHRAHLEAQHGARDHSEREQREHYLRPAPRERQVEITVAAMTEPLDEQDHRRKRDTEGDKRDVDRERQRLHLPRLQQVVLVDRREYS